MRNGTKNQEVKSAVEFLLSRIGLKIEDIDYFVTDNGSNVTAAFKSEAKGNIMSPGPINILFTLGYSVSVSKGSMDGEADEDETSESTPESDEISEEEASGSDLDDGEEMAVDNDFPLVELNLPGHLTCIDHSLELVLHSVIDKKCNGNRIGSTLQKTRKLISRVSIARIKLYTLIF